MVTECPYKGTTSGYWSAKIGNEVRPDIVWTYTFPTRQVLAIVGMIAFDNEKVDTYLDGDLLERPDTHFSPKRAAAEGSLPEPTIPEIRHPGCRRPGQ